VDSLTKLALEIGAIAGIGFLVELMISKLRRGPRRRTDSRVDDRRYWLLAAQRSSPEGSQLLRTALIFAVGQSV